MKKKLISLVVFTLLLSLTLPALGQNTTLTKGDSDLLTQHEYKAEGIKELRKDKYIVLDFPCDMFCDDLKIHGTKNLGIGLGDTVSVHYIKADAYIVGKESVKEWRKSRKSTERITVIRKRPLGKEGKDYHKLPRICKIGAEDTLTLDVLAEVLKKAMGMGANKILIVKAGSFYVIR